MNWSERLAGYKLDPALPVAQVERFEKRNGVALPAEYRTFITTVCSGIYVEPSQPDRLAELLRPPKLDLDESLSRPFPLIEYRPFDDDEAYERARGGQLYLATDGCTCDWYLIVTGPERGGMWEIEAEGAQPCSPKLTFLPWLKLRLDCDSGRNSTDWWDAAWQDLDPAATESALVERYAQKESMLRAALRAELERQFPDGAYRPGEDDGTIAIFPAAHPEVGNVAICNDGDKAIVIIGSITREHFRSDKSYDDVKSGTAVARSAIAFLADLLADRILLWQSTGGLTGGYHIRRNSFREEDIERFGRYYLWSGPIEMEKPSTRGWKLW